MASQDVLLMTRENETASKVRSALESSPLLALVNVCQDTMELRAFLSNGAMTTRQAVVVDIDPKPTRVLHELSKVTTAHPEIPFIVVSKEFNENVVLEAMQAGARHFLRKKSIESELDAVLERLLCSETKREVALGDIISVFSCSGGCGATTVAVNLANELRLASSESVMIIDLDKFYGAVATYLGITGQYGIADVLRHKSPIDRHLIESSAMNYTEDFHVLLSPASVGPGRPQSLRYENLEDALESCQETHRYIVVDAPRVPERVAANLAAVSKLTLIVFQLTVRDLKVARSMMSFLTESGIAAERILPLANRVRKRGPLVRLEDSKRVVGVESLHLIRSDWSKAMKSVNQGRPLAEVARRSGLRRDFRKLAAKIRAYKVNGNGTSEGNGSA